MVDFNLWLFVCIIFFKLFSVLFSHIKIIDNGQKNFFSTHVVSYISLPLFHLQYQSFIIITYDLVSECEPCEILIHRKNIYHLRLIYELIKFYHHLILLIPLNLFIPSHI